MQSLLARVLVFITSILQGWKQRFLVAKGARKAAWVCFPILGACIICSIMGLGVETTKRQTSTPTTVVLLAPTPTATPLMMLDEIHIVTRFCVDLNGDRRCGLDEGVEKLPVVVLDADTGDKLARVRQIPMGDACST
jgi:hypothetical protein